LGRRASDFRKIRQLGWSRDGRAAVKTYGTAWGGYALIEVDDPEAFGRYQAHHNQNYGHVARITFEPVFDFDAAFAQRVSEIRR
jgi:hypothetical protein